MKKLKIVSLFDGMSCAQIAINRIGLNDYIYYASELDKYAIKVTQANYPNTIQLGDVTKIDFTKIEDVDLLIGGSPCQGFSFAGKQLNFEDERSKLFFEFVRALKELKPRYFLLENVNMKKEYQDVISEHLGVEPVEINSSLVSAQNRKRLYWTNITNINDPKEINIKLEDIVEYGFVDRDKAYCIDASYFKGGNPKQYFEKSRRQLVFGRIVGRRLVDGKRVDYNKSIPIKQIIEPNKNPNKSNVLSTAQKDNIIISNIVLKEKSQTLLSTMYKENPKSMIKRNKKGLIVGEVEDNLVWWRKLTPIECERLQTVPDNYTQLIKRDKKCYANKKIVIGSQELKNMETTVSSIIKESSVMETQILLETILSIKELTVVTAIEKLKQGECVETTITTGTEMVTHFTLKRSELDLVQEAITKEKTELQTIELLSKIISAGNLNQMKLSIILIVIKVMTELKTSIFAKGNRNIHYCISNLKESQGSSLEMVISSFQTESIKEVVSSTQRYKMLGNGFTVDVIAHILKNMEI